MIPSDLELVIVEMLRDYYKSLHQDSTKGDLENTGEIKAVTRGKTRIEYNVSSNNTINKVSSIDDLLLNYKKQLIRFKKIGSVRVN